MAATRISFRQTVVCPDDEFVIPHVEDGWIQVFEGDLLTASTGKPEFSVCYAVVEPLSAKEEKEYNQQAAEREKAKEARGESGD